jgi:hypothetical protein
VLCSTLNQIVFIAVSDELLQCMQHSPFSIFLPSGSAFTQPSSCTLGFSGQFISVSAQVFPTLLNSIVGCVNLLRRRSETCFLPFLCVSHSLSCGKYCLLPGEDDDPVCVIPLDVLPFVVLFLGPRNGRRTLLSASKLINQEGSLTKMEWNAHRARDTLSGGSFYIQFVQSKVVSRARVLWRI